jgi:hypothetical protein
VGLAMSSRERCATCGRPKAEKAESSTRGQCIAWLFPEDKTCKPPVRSTLTYKGKTRTLAEWAADLGLDPERGPAVLRKRRRLGWPVRDVLTKPVRTWKAI